MTTLNEVAERLKPIFFIGEGGSRVIFGPYTVIGKPYYDETYIGGISRLEEVNPEFGIWKIKRIICPNRIRFNPNPIDLKITKGLSWIAICKMLCIDPKGWRNLIAVTLSIEQVNDLANKLIEINQ
ncbi:MAG: hypothetical protein ABH837_02875 [bacterium]